MQPDCCRLAFYIGRGLSIRPRLLLLDVWVAGLDHFTELEVRIGKRRVAESKAELITRFDIILANSGVNIIRSVTRED